MSWKRINNQQDWQDHCRAFEDANTMSRDPSLWTSKPKSFPCLVTSVTELRWDNGTATVVVLSAFVYPADAQLLLTDVPDAGPPPSSGPTQADFNAHFAASLLTLVQLAINSRLIGNSEYEKRLAANLHVVDQWNASNVRRDAIARVVDAASAVLGPVYPPNQG